MRHSQDCLRGKGSPTLLLPPCLCPTQPSSPHSSAALPSEPFPRALLSSARTPLEIPSPQLGCAGGLPPGPTTYLALYPHWPGWSAGS